MTELEELRLAYAECSRQKSELLTAHKVSAAENAALRAELAKHQESEFHPDWSMLEATRDSLAEHQQIIRDLRERIKVLERINVLEDALLELVGACDDDSLTRLEEALSAARAALGDKRHNVEANRPKTARKEL